MLVPVNWGGTTREPPAVFRRYIVRNMERELEEIELGEAKAAPLYIVCSGPSLLETWTELKDRPGEIWALNNAFDWLCKQGIRPDYGVCLASEKAILRYFQEVAKDDKFLFGSMTHPDLVDRVQNRGGHVKLWHCESPPEWNLPLPKNRGIYGGGTVGSRAFELAYVLGWRDIHILGMDACLSLDGRVSVDIPMWEDQKQFLRTFVVGGRAFVAMPSHARQVEMLGPTLAPLTGMEVTFYGDGMMQWAMQSQQTPMERP